MQKMVQTARLQRWELEDCDGNVRVLGEDLLLWEVEDWEVEDWDRSLK